MPNRSPIPASTPVTARRAGRPVATATLTLALLLGLAPLAPALAHTGYLLPAFFHTEKAEAVTVEAAFADRFFRPELPLDTDGFAIFGPDGKEAKFARVERFANMAVLEAQLPQPGTYRLSSGERLGRLGRAVKTDKGWESLAPGKEPAAGQEVKTIQTATVSDVYVTKGAATDAPVKRAVGRLHLTPDTHPNQLRPGQPVRFTVTFAGKPLANHEVTFALESGPGEAPAEQALTTDAAGKVATPALQPGRYLAWVRHRADAPAGSQTQLRSYTTALTFEVAAPQKQAAER